MHSGYCSAPRTIFPPWTGAGPPVLAAGPGVVLLLHAAATRPATETAATVRMSQRNRIPFPPFSRGPLWATRESLQRGCAPCNGPLCSYQSVVRESAQWGLDVDWD